jgi:hypothetical protein
MLRIKIAHRRQQSPGRTFHRTPASIASPSSKHSSVGLLSVYGVHCRDDVSERYAQTCAAAAELEVDKGKDCESAVNAVSWYGRIALRYGCTVSEGDDEVEY